MLRYNPSQLTQPVGLITSIFLLLIALPQLNAQSKIALDASNISNLGIRGDASRLVDEQSAAGDPQGGQGGNVYTAFDQTYNTIYNPATILVKLFQDYSLSELWYYDSNGKDTIAVYGGDPSHWEFLGNIITDRYNQWRAFAINDTFKFLRLDFRHPQATVREIVLYGTALGTNLSTPATGNNPAPVAMHTLMGINGFVDDPLDQFDATAGTLREYHRWDWDEGNGQAGYTGYPNSAYAFSPSYVSIWDFDQYYKDLYDRGMSIAPVLQGSPPHIRGNRTSDSKPIDPSDEPEDPQSYKAHAEYMYQFAARYGSTAVPASELKLRGGQSAKSGLAYISYLENWNEPDKWWRGRDGYFSPFELGAMSSADADGHEGALGPGYGMKAADPNMKMVMPGLATLDLDYLDGLRLWLEYNRQSGFPFDVINFHHYSNNASSSFGNSTKGISPEDDRLKERLQAIVDYRNQWLPGVEIWLSEFGYDTNPSSIQGAPAIGPNDEIEVQGQWIMRSFLEIAASGIDRAQLYMLRDVNNPNPNRYNSSGLTAEKYNQHQEKKSFYYVAGMRNILRDFIFDGEIAMADSDLRAYRFRQENSDSICVALWSATSSARSIPNFKYSVSGMGLAWLQEVNDSSARPNCTKLMSPNDSITIAISERPVFLKLLPEDFVSPTAVAQNITLYLDRDGLTTIDAQAVDNGSSDDMKVVRFETIPAQLDCGDLNAQSTNVSVQFLACDHYNCDTVSFTVNLNDTIAPQIITQESAVFLDAQGLGTVSASDFIASASENCSDSIIYSLDQSQFDCSHLKGGSTISLVSDASWMKSTYTSLVQAGTWPWAGAGDFPASSTYTDSVDLGQPQNWHTIDAVPGSQVIKAGSRVQYFRTYFQLDDQAKRALFQMTVDDDMEIYLNGQLIGRENVWGAPSRGAGAIHGFELHSNGNHKNGPDGLTPFGLLTSSPLNDVLVKGQNEILVVVRNGGPGNVGGFSFRMDLETKLLTEVISDGTWEKSTLTSTNQSITFPWVGAQELPSEASFSLAAEVGQPRNWKTIDEVQDAEVIKTGAHVTFFRKKFQTKGNFWSGLKFWMRVDDDMEVYLNGTLIARENIWGSTAIGAGSLRSFSYGSAGAENGSDSTATFQFLHQNALSLLHEGENELMLAIRNTGNSDLGGFSVKMEVEGQITEVVQLSATDSYGNTSSYDVLLCVMDTLAACSMSSSNSAKRLVSANENPSKELFSLQPNPTDGLLFIHNHSEEASQLELIVRNVSGQTLSVNSFHLVEGNSNSIDLSHLPAGVYLIQLKSESGMNKIERIVKH